MNFDDREIGLNSRKLEKNLKKKKKKMMDDFDERNDGWELI